MLFVLLFAVMVYLLVRLLDRGQGGRAARRPPNGRPTQPDRRTIAPDDDEQFLRDLERRRKERNEKDTGD